MSARLQRSALLLHMGATMKRLSHQYQLPFVVVNQVNDVFSNSSSSRSAFAASTSRQVAPAMGLSWSHCVNTRIMLSRIAGAHAWQPPGGSGSTADGEDLNSAALRQMEVVFSPCDPNCRAEYVIDAEGIRGVGGGGEEGTPRAAGQAWEDCGGGGGGS